MIALMLVTVRDILGRWLFGSPFPGTVELTQLAMVAILYLGLAYAQHEGDHISVDILYLRLGRRWRAAFDLVAAVLSLAVLLLLAWRLFEFSKVLRGGGYTTGVLHIPQYPFAFVAIVGVAAFFLAVVVTSRGAATEDSDDASEEGR